MCGIAGYVGHDSRVIDLERALLSLHHRGPDGRGTFVDEATRVGLGHTRLAIIDLACGAQPLYSEDQDIVLVCNGEIYDFERIRGELEALGHRFYTHSDSEVIIHLYEEYGLDFMRHLRGEFAFLLYDKTQQSLLAVRDRFGIKPLFFHCDDHKYLFGSEAKAIFALGPLAAKIDAVAIRDLFSFVSPDSIFEGIEVVPPGCMLKINLPEATHEIVQYWDVDLQPDTAAPYAESMDQAVASVREVVEQAIRLRLRADVPLGVYLSGGIDSAIVAAMAAKHIPGALKVFTVEFPEEDLYNEYQLAKNMAAKVGADFHSVRCDHHALLENTEDSLWTTELPFLNFHGVGKFMLSRLAREHVTVVLTGEGSDEVFLGYGIFRGAEMAKPATHQAPRPGSKYRKIYDDLGYSPNLGFRLLFSSCAQDLLHLFFSKQQRQKLRGTNPAARLVRRLQRKQLEKLPDMRQRQYVWIKCMLPQYILTMLGDRSELAHSIEGRTPFLDHHLFEHARHVADRFKIHNGVEKHVLREAFKDDITPEIYGRKKWPYTAPPLWIRKGDHPKLDALIDKHLSKAAIQDGGLFSYTTLRVCQFLSSALFFNCIPKRIINSFLLYILTAQILHHAYVRVFPEELERRAIARG